MKNPFAWSAGLMLTSWAGAFGETMDIPASADTGILDLNPTFNLGAESDFPSGRLGTNAGTPLSRGLYRFDLAGAIPSNAVVEFASLRLTVTAVPLGAANSAFGLHRMLRPWGEGNKTGSNPGGAAASAGEATWNSAFHLEQNWSSPGGEAGVDYVAEPSSSDFITGAGEYHFEFGGDGLEDLRDWIEAPESNHGWMLKSADEATNKTARRFAARERASGTPVLTVVYSVPVAVTAPELEVVLINPTEVEVRFQGEANVVYQLQEAVQFDDWTTFREIPAGDPSIEIVTTVVLQSDNHRFYRVIATADQ